MSEIDGVSGNVKQAREQALVGNYDESKVYYEGAILGVKKLLKQTHDPETKQKWQEVRLTITKSIPSSFLNYVRWKGTICDDLLPFHVVGIINAK